MLEQLGKQFLHLAGISLCTHTGPARTTLVASTTGHDTKCLWHMLLPHLENTVYIESSVAIAILT